MQGAQIQPLVGELRSRMPHSAAKKKKKECQEIQERGLRGVSFQYLVIATPSELDLQMNEKFLESRFKTHLSLS